MSMDQQTDNWEHCLQHAALSDVGLRRANNQDAMTVVIADSQAVWQQHGHLFMVADGMGAHAAGELASKIATDTVALTYFKLLDRPPAEALLTAVTEANDRIYGRGLAEPEFKGMGTTATSMVLLPEGALLAHVGDSRAYRLRGDRLEQLTFDHSLVWELRAAGQLADGASADHIPKNIITRSLGPNGSVQIDMEGPFPIAVGDTYVLCSDGLSGPVEDEEIGVIVGAMPPDEAARALVNLAILRGGPDNITVIVARVTAPLKAKTGRREPETSKRRLLARPVHPALWTLLGVLALAAAGAALMHYWPAALVCLTGALIAALVALLTPRDESTESGFPTAGRPLGKGPYTTCNARVDGQFVDRINEIVAQLRDAATDGKWSVDWSHFNALTDRAKSAEESGDHASAVRACFGAIDFLMAELKKQGRNVPGNGGGSTLDS